MYDINYTHFVIVTTKVYKYTVYNDYETNEKKSSSMGFSRITINEIGCLYTMK